MICVGTTSCRTVESAADENGKLKECSGWTEIFIYPGYKFKCTGLPDHELPFTGVNADHAGICAGRKRACAMRAYEEAVKERYRFFSFGDAMFIE